MNRHVSFLLGTVLVAGCLSREVGTGAPTTKEVFETTLSQTAIDKVDLLFAIDNSASMGDKQSILAAAVPNLVQGLLRPRCVDTRTRAPGDTLADPNGSEANRFGCPAGSEPEFKPVTDLHVGIVSSSLGSLGGDVCAPVPGKRNDDQAHLLGYVKGAAPDLSSSNFLAWFPANPENSDPNRHPPPDKPIRSDTDLVAQFQALVEGTGQAGCGLEAQLESWYRFLVQPDPWESVTVEKGQAVLNGIDGTLLRQRADFLRPDSLVAVIVLTDEDDSSADPLSLGGTGWSFMAERFPNSNVARANNGGTTAARGTSICETDPGSKDCTSCGFATECTPGNAECERIKNDPSCRKLGATPPAGGSDKGYAGYHTPEDERINVRFHDMKRRFGVDPQYPIDRYVNGLRSPKVPDREAEHPVLGQLEDGRSRIGNYANTAKCDNPLFAKNLPREAGANLCKLERGPRTPDRVFYAVIGGVPHQLLHFVPGNPQASEITDADWVKILGKDPKAYDLSGIDPHMLQSTEHRAGISARPNGDRDDRGSDPFHGREWDTKKADLQYACTFELPSPRDCPDPRDESCDCARPEDNPPLCAGKKQLRGKAYPTIRELRVARELGPNGIVASLCPIQTSNPDAADYGYKPAVAAIVERLKKAFTQCLPTPLAREETTNEVPCLVLAQLEAGDACERYGLDRPPPEVAQVFAEEQRELAGGSDELASLPVCVVPQLPVPAGGSCKEAEEVGFCYVTNTTAAAPAGACSQAVLFSNGSKTLTNARFSLQCINVLGAGVAAGDQPRP